MSTTITVIGNVTRNPQLSRTHSGTPMVNLTLAENHRRQVDGEWVDGAVTYWEIVCYGAQAENLIGSLVPSWDMEWELVRLANRHQILAVVVGGRPRLWRGWPVDWDAGS